LFPARFFVQNAPFSLMFHVLRADFFPLSTSSGISSYFCFGCLSVPSFTSQSLQCNLFLLPQLLLPPLTNLFKYLYGKRFFTLSHSPPKTPILLFVVKYSLFLQLKYVPDAIVQLPLHVSRFSSDPFVFCRLQTSHYFAIQSCLITPLPPS
jgi:hypothetical protein